MLLPHLLSLATGFKFVLCIFGFRSCTAAKQKQERGHGQKEALPREIVEDVFFDDIRHFGTPLASVMNVEGDDGHGAGERDEADGDSIVQTFGVKREGH